MTKRRVLFLCIGNTCRSQIAEAIVNTRLGGEWQAYSAGSRPTPGIDPRTIAVLAEIGIAHTGRSKSVDEFRGQPFDLVVTVCADDAEDCPVWLGKGDQAHLPFPDPGKASDRTGALEVFRAVRDDMLVKIPGLLQDWLSTHP